jgi:hypothetical protein
MIFKVLDDRELFPTHDTKTTSVSRTLTGEMNHSLASTVNDLFKKELMSSSCTHCRKILQHIFHIIPHFAENFFRAPFSARFSIAPQARDDSTR